MNCHLRFIFQRIPSSQPAKETSCINNGFSPSRASQANSPSPKPLPRRFMIANTRYVVMYPEKSARLSLEEDCRASTTKVTSLRYAPEPVSLVGGLETGTNQAWRVLRKSGKKTATQPKSFITTNRRRLTSQILPWSKSPKAEFPLISKKFIAAWPVAPAPPCRQVSTYHFLPNDAK